MIPFLAMLLQVGPAPSVDPISPVPPELREQRAMERAKRNATVTVDRHARLYECLDNLRADVETGEDQARAWLKEARGAERGDAAQCLGVALSEQGEWRDAADAFLQAREGSDRGDAESRALRGALAGGAMLSAKSYVEALSLLDEARADAKTAAVAELIGEIAIDRSLALVALNRSDEAEAALDEARNALPGDPQGWLLSATLSRRLGKLDAAQQQIQHAAQLAPADPAVGLEAGVIAAMAGRDDAARRSWQSVIDTAPGSDQAKTAQDYIDQLGAG